ncbi:helix-turn-helix domain-containing protein [Thermogemmatispora sp.]|uniref:helix-turn-helix domain-containing protein n=1 Tax=Thermogemmatispora sp. TaxID=1968838 RepID=UPI001E06C130|nr:helix-turn-helix domain-containing protein [Thermogemmatispora sp.]MBX5451236.1 helix-turn-helix domain-containing protein [Thermogemmatispora sp.]
MARMDRRTIQQLKMAWLAAEERGDKQAQIALLRAHPEAQEALIDFIVAYRATALEEEDGAPASPEEIQLLPLTERARQRALERVFGGRTDHQSTTEDMPASLASVKTLRELRLRRRLSLTEAARGLHLGVDVWKKFEDGLIDVLSLSARQLERLANFFNISPQQFSELLHNSQPLLALNRRQTGEAARQQRQAAPPKQSFAEAIARSDMSEQEKRLWLEE